MSQLQGVMAITAVLALIGGGATLMSLNVDGAWYCPSNQMVAFNIINFSESGTLAHYQEGVGTDLISKCEVAWTPLKGTSLLKKDSTPTDCKGRFIGTKDGWSCE